MAARPAFRLLLWLWGLCLLAGLQLPAMAQNYPEYDEVYVNDFDGLIDAAREDRIRAYLTGLYDSRGIEFTVVTLTGMDRYGHYGEIEPFATALFNRWGVGDASRNDGVMLLVAKDDRQMRIELGAGYASAKDREMKRIIDGTILPRFRRDDYAGGIEEGVREVIRNLTGSYPYLEPQSFGERVTGWLRRTTDTLGLWLYAVLAGAAGLLFRLYVAWQRRRPRNCPEDGSRMTLLDEAWDDNHLQQGQITEERLGSVQYDVWDCPACNHLTVEAYRAWFSRYGACRSCGFRTMEGTTTTLEYATTSSEGRKRIDYRCHNCNDGYSVERTIPRKSESSSGSSRSSFGGGRSSGGGASGRW